MADKKNETKKKNVFLIYLGFLRQPFTNHRTAGERGGHSLTPH